MGTCGDGERGRRSAPGTARLDVGLGSFRSASRCLPPSCSPAASLPPPPLRGAEQKGMQEGLVAAQLGPVCPSTPYPLGGCSSVSSGLPPQPARAGSPWLWGGETGCCAGDALCRDAGPGCWQNPKTSAGDVGTRRWESPTLPCSPLRRFSAFCKQKERQSFCFSFKYWFLRVSGCKSVQ